MKTTRRGVGAFYEECWRSPDENGEDAARRDFQRDLIERALARLGDVRGRTVVEIGRGRGHESAALVRAGARTLSIDLAQSALLRTRAETCGGAQPLRAAAEALPLADATVDAVFAQTVLMHLDLRRAAAQWERVLKRGGRVVVLEPLAGNPLLRLYRRWSSPYRRTRPRYVTLAELRSASPGLRLVHHEEHYLVSVLAAKLPRAIARPLDSLLGALDRVLLRVPGAGRLAWMILAELVKERRTPSGPLASPCPGDPADSQCQTLQLRKRFEHGEVPESG